MPTPTESSSNDALGETPTFELRTRHQRQAQRIDRVFHFSAADLTAWREGGIARVRKKFLTEDRIARSSWNIARGQRLDARKGEDRRWSGKQVIHYPPLLL
jgi:hypothetical protein